MLRAFVMFSIWKSGKMPERKEGLWGRAWGPIQVGGSEEGRGRVCGGAPEFN